MHGGWLSLALKIYLGVLMAQTESRAWSQEIAWSPVADPALEVNPGQTLSAAWGDFENDGRPDLFLANRYIPAGFLFRNGTNGFERVAAGPVFEDSAERGSAAW